MRRPANCSSPKRFRRRISADSGYVLIAFAVDYALQVNVAILHDDSNRFLHTQSVSLKSRITVNSTEQTPTDAVVHRRGRKNFNLVVDTFDAFDVFDCV